MLRSNSDLICSPCIIVDQPPTVIIIVTSCAAAFITFVTAIAAVIICIVLKKKGMTMKEQEDVPVYESVPLPPNVALTEPCKSDWTATKAQESGENYYDEVKTIHENITLTENDAYSFFKPSSTNL